MPASAPSSKPLWQKLGIRPGETLHVYGAPIDVARHALVPDGATADGTSPMVPPHTVRDGLPASLGRNDVALLFADSAPSMHGVAAALRPLVDGTDVRVWIAFPKGASKGSSTGDAKGDAGALTRDRGWEPITALGLESVSLVALDARWSAMRVRDRVHVASRAARQAAPLARWLGWVGAAA